MNKKKWLVISLLVGILIISGFYQYLSNVSKQEQKNILKKDTISYLVGTGYDEETDIKDIFILDFHEQIDNDEIDKYQAIVTLENEPDKWYFYTYKKNTKELIQFDLINNKIIELQEHKE
ncbi:hypothetical protein ACFVSW_17130 [Neobacillus sp. NPDC058068]|uniref:hypothetical protein n=1 Tax=Neobacillus sp. NPDC058068 TaxID=3346325 RepID=UPI0036D7FEF7